MLGLVKKKGADRKVSSSISGMKFLLCN